MEANTLGGYDKGNGTTGNTCPPVQPHPYRCRWASLPLCMWAGFRMINTWRNAFESRLAW